MSACYCARVVAGTLLLCCCRNAFAFFLQGSQQNSYWGWSRQSVQLVRKRSAWPICSWSLGEGRGGRQLFGLRSPFFTHWEASPLQELWTALLPEVSQSRVSFGLFSIQNFRLGKAVACQGTLLKDKVSLTKMQPMKKKHQNSQNFQGGIRKDRSAPL